MLQIRYRRIVIRPPVGKRKRYPELVLIVIHAREINNLKNRDQFDWSN